MTIASINAIPRRKVRLLLEPLDVLFFRDGRPFTQASRGRSGLPAPQTLAGAIRTRLLEEARCDFAAMASALETGRTLDEAIEAGGGPRWIAQVQVRGPWLARNRDPQTIELLVPAPAALHQEKRTAESQASTPLDLLRLDPLAPTKNLPGWRPPIDGMRPLWLSQDVSSERAAGYLTVQGLKDYLAGNVPSPSELVKPQELYEFDHRTGITVEAKTQTAEDELIYAASFLALRPGVSFCAELVAPADVPLENWLDGAAIPFGGEGRRVNVEVIEEPLAWPEAEPRDKQHSLMLLTTPGVFDGGWAPRPLRELGRLAGAAVAGHEPVSGWDMVRNGPKSTRFAVPAGSVYFLASPEADEFSDGSLCERPEDRLQGWGCFVKGAWSYA